MWPREAKVAHRQEIWKAQQKRGDSQKEVRRTFKMLREIWLNIGVEKLDMHKGITIKVLLNSGATRIFMNKGIAV